MGEDNIFIIPLTIKQLGICQNVIWLISVVRQLS